MPAKTAKNVIVQLHEAIAKSLQSASLRESYAKMGVLPGGSVTPEEPRLFRIRDRAIRQAGEGNRVEDRVTPGEVLAGTTIALSPTAVKIITSRMDAEA